MLALGGSLALAGCSSRVSALRKIPTKQPGPDSLNTTTTTTPYPSPPPPVVLNDIPQPVPGPPTIIFGGPSGTRQIALTIDDGYCSGCISSYVAFAQESGIHITFSPNGVFGPLWTSQLPIVRPLIEAGQVQIGNHTWDHRDLVTLSDTAVANEITRNELWIEDTFGITARPWFRPPYGSHDSRTDDIAGELGYTNILMWNGSFGDSEAISPAQLLSLASQYLQPTTIMLGHLNHPTILSLFPQIQALIEQRDLQPVTLDEMFGTARNGISPSELQ
jgi:peptidoglycan/xylan/chitin deacetylase (PgdA/CDA1 family)